MPAPTDLGHWEIIIAAWLIAAAALTTVSAFAFTLAFGVMRERGPAAVRVAAPPVEARPQGVPPAAPAYPEGTPAAVAG